MQTHNSLYAALNESVFIREHWEQTAEDIYEAVAFRNVIGGDKRLQSSGVAFARKAHNSAMVEKANARRRILDSLARDEWPDKLRLLTLPGLEWVFENKLIDARDYGVSEIKTSVKFKGADANLLDSYLIRLVGRLRERGVRFAGPIPRPTKPRELLPHRRRILFTDLPEAFDFDLPDQLEMKAATFAMRQHFRGKDEQTEFVAVERDPAVYFGSIKWMPGATAGLTQLSPHSLCTSKIGLYYFTDVETLLGDPACPEVDAAWLDFTGYMTPRLLCRINRFWKERCKWQLAVTVLNARYPSHVKAEVRKHGGMAEWITNYLGGELYDCYHYFDEYSAMLQLILRKKAS